MRFQITALLLAEVTRGNEGLAHPVRIQSRSTAIVNQMLVLTFIRCREASLCYTTRMI